MNPNGKWELTVIDSVSDNSGTLQSWGLKQFFVSTTDIDWEINNLPYEFKLYQNYPNPFYQNITISWNLLTADIVTWIRTQPGHTHGSGFFPGERHDG